MYEVNLKIGGMACDGCAARLQGVLAASSGIRSADVSFGECRAIVRFNEHVVSVEAIHDIIRRAGFEPDPTD